MNISNTLSRGVQSYARKHHVRPGVNFQTIAAAARANALTVCQQLLPKIGGGRAMAMEILTPTPAVRNLIRESKVHQIYSAMQTGRQKSGMQTLNHSLADLVVRKQVRYEDARIVSSDTAELDALIFGGGPAVPPGHAAP